MCTNLFPGGSLVLPFWGKLSGNDPIGKAVSRGALLTLGSGGASSSFLLTLTRVPSWGSGSVCVWGGGALGQRSSIFPLAIPT